MGAISDAFDLAFRDYVTEGLPGSGAHEPEKTQIRAIGDLVESAIGVGIGAVTVAKTTKAVLDADLAHGAGTTAIVYADSADANNDLYVKVGGSGSGSWTNTGALNASFYNRIKAERAKVPSPFLSAVADDYMRKLVVDLYIEGGDPGHDYILNYETQNLGGGNARVTFKVTDTTLGIDSCQWQFVETQANLLARTSPTVVAYQGALTGYTGTTATFWVNWSALVFGGGITSYTSPSQSGIRNDRVISRDQIMDRFKRGAEPKRVLTVGAGTPTATHFNTRAAAIASLYIPGLTVTRSGPFPLSDSCSFSNQVLILDVDDAIDEEATLTTISGVDQSEIVLPPFVTLRGRGPSSRIYADTVGNSGPAVEAPFPFRIEHMTVENVRTGYAVHIDNVDDRAKRATTGPAILRYPMISVFKSSTLRGGATTATWVIGCGISNGQTIRLESSRCYTSNGSSQILGIHTSPTMQDAGDIEVIDTYFNDALVPGAEAIGLVKSNAGSIQHRVRVQGSDLAKIEVGNTAGGAAGFIRLGKIDPTITITGTLST